MLMYFNLFNILLSIFNVISLPFCSVYIATLYGILSVCMLLYVHVTQEIKFF
jgi:hypothetical protein